MLYSETTATKKVAALNKRIRAIQGGTSASKTISILLYLIAYAQTDKAPTLTSIVAESFPHLRRGAMRDFLLILQTQGYFDESRWDKTNSVYTFETDSQIEFFSVDQPEKVRGARRDRLFINECNNVSFEAFEELEIRTKEFILLDWNPTSEFWFYDKVLGKREDVEHIILTYLDNEACPEEIVKSIESRRNRPGWFKVYGEGQLGEVDGRIYTGWEIIPEVPHGARLERHGLDFGYDPDPAAVVDVYYLNGAYIFDEVLYARGLNNIDLANALKNLPPRLTIADSAEPKSIDEIKLYGVSIMPVAKGPDFRRYGISIVQSYPISVTRRSVNLIKEYRNYLWKTDKDGNIIPGVPEDGNDHALDAARYAMMSLVPVIQRKELADTPGKYIEVYEVHGTLPAKFLTPGAPDTYVGQLQIVLMYTGQDGKRKGITLFKGKEKKLDFKLVLRDEIFGRALGFGGAEELFEPQIWTNFSQVHKKEMLVAASKIILKSTDPAVTSKNKVRDMENLQVLELAPGTDISPVDTQPRNIAFFDSFDAEWDALAKEMGSATGAMLGQNPAGGGRMSYNAMALLTSQGQAIHDYRKGKLATFVEEIYRDWILPRVVAEMNQGQEFLADSTPDELESIADQVVTCEANKFIIDRILSGKVVNDDIVTQFKQKVRDEFTKGGNKRFLKIMKDELAEVPMQINISIANKQKDTAGMVDKMTKMVQLVLSTFNPQTGTFAALEDKRVAALLNQMFEYSGLSPIQFGGGSSQTRQGGYQQLPPGAQQMPPGQGAPQAAGRPQLPALATNQS